MKITDKQRLNKLISTGDLYDGLHGWSLRIFIEGKTEDTVRQAIDAAIRAGERNKI